MTGYSDISPAFKPNANDSKICMRILPYEATPEAIQMFDKVKHNIKHDYTYWFLLSTLWVSYTGWSNLELWKQLFSSSRPQRKISIMKPSELDEFRRLPETIQAWRAVRTGESDWIAYTTDYNTAKRFATERKSLRIDVYEIPKNKVLAYFTRRKESEIILLDKTHAVLVSSIKCTHWSGSTEVY